MDETLATAIHECSHVVVAFLLDVPQMHVSLTGTNAGETIPECALCTTCVEYYWHHDPAHDDHARAIRDDLRKDAAVAIAGELGEVRHTGAQLIISESETTHDRYKARSRASAVHFWSSNPQCYEYREWDKPCGACNAFLAELRRTIDATIAQPQTWKAINGLAERLVSAKRIEWAEIVSSLSGFGLRRGQLSADGLPQP